MDFRTQTRRLTKEGRGRRGQLIIEYAVIFTVIIAVILFASVTWIKPAVNRFFNSTVEVINQATERVQNNF